MTWLIIILSLYQQPDIKLEMEFKTFTLCNYARDRLLETRPSANIDGEFVAVTYKELKCTNQRHSTKKKEEDK